MNIILISAIALLASALTLFSGFGLGTILVPVFCLFFPVDLAVSLTAIVHLLNNIFKLGLLGKNANKEIILRFGIPSVITAFLGAYLLTELSMKETLFDYQLGNHFCHITSLKLVVGILMFIFALWDLIPAFSRMEFDKKYIPFGGLLSGFFGGLSGNQGALRSAFLLRAGLSKEAFIATGVTIAVLTDFARISLYFQIFKTHSAEVSYTHWLFPALAAFAGAWLGNKFLKKISIQSVHFLVAVFLIIFSLLLGSGII